MGIFGMILFEGIGVCFRDSRKVVVGFGDELLVVSDVMFVFGCVWLFFYYGDV